MVGGEDAAPFQHLWLAALIFIEEKLGNSYPNQDRYEYDAVVVTGDPPLPLSGSSLIRPICLPPPNKLMKYQPG